MPIDLIKRIATSVPAGSILPHESDGSIYRAVGWQGGRDGGPASFLYTVDLPVCAAPCPLPSGQPDTPAWEYAALDPALVSRVVWLHKDM